MLTSLEYKSMLEDLVKLPNVEEVLGEDHDFITDTYSTVYDRLFGSIMDLRMWRLDKIEELHDRHC